MRGCIQLCMYIHCCCLHLFLLLFYEKKLQNYLKNLIINKVSFYFTKMCRSFIWSRKKINMTKVTISLNNKKPLFALRMLSVLLATNPKWQPPCKRNIEIKTLQLEAYNTTVDDIWIIRELPRCSCFIKVKSRFNRNSLTEGKQPGGLGYCRTEINRQK